MAMNSFKKMIMMANQIEDKPSLPKEYVQLEYLESTGTQYIDVPVAWKDINSITVTCQTTGTIGGTNQAVLGSKTGYSATQCWGVRSSATYKEWQWVTGLDPYLKITANLFMTIENNAVSGSYGYIIADTQDIINTSNSEFVPIGNLQLFATFNNNRRFLGKIFHIAINNKAVNLIPALRIADSKPGMYDLVSGQFFTNQGTGEFAYSSVISTINIILESIITGEELDNMDSLLQQISQSQVDMSSINTQLENIINT